MVAVGGVCLVGMVAAILRVIICRRKDDDSDEHMKSLSATVQLHQDYVNVNCNANRNDTVYEDLNRPIYQNTNVGSAYKRYASLKLATNMRYAILSGKIKEKMARSIEEFAGVTDTRAYIATQGPKPYTFNDYWKMVWQHNSGKIVMLTNLIENGKAKCDGYWPEEGKPLDTGSFQLVLGREKQYSFYTMRKITISHKKDSSTRLITQFHYTNWPEYGTPNCQEFLQFHRRIMNEHTRLSGPPVVHCSAGIGRTGIFIALDALYVYGKSNRDVNIKTYVESMLQNRASIMQSADQYRYLHETLAEAFVIPDTLTTKQEFIKRFVLKGELNVQAQMEEEFKLLREIVQRVVPADNINSSEDIPSADRYGTTENHDANYITAVRVPLYTCGRGYIVTQYPTVHTVDSFWSMVKGNKITTIVVLGTAEATEVKHWLPIENQPIMTKMSIIVNSQTTPTSVDSGIHRDEVTISNKISREDVHVAVIRAASLPKAGWTERSVTTYLTLLEHIDRHVVDNDHQLLVMCPDGFKFCGVFCLLSSIKQQLLEDDEIDIFQATRRIQSARPQFIQTLDQYEFCYKATTTLLGRSYKNESAANYMSVC